MDLSTKVISSNTTTTSSLIVIRPPYLWFLCLQILPRSNWIGLCVCSMYPFPEQICNLIGRMVSDHCFKSHSMNNFHICNIASSWISPERYDHYLWTNEWIHFIFATYIKTWGFITINKKIMYLDHIKLLPWWWLTYCSIVTIETIVFWSLGKSRQVTKEAIVF